MTLEIKNDPRAIELAKLELAMIATIQLADTEKEESAATISSPESEDPSAPLEPKPAKKKKAILSNIAPKILPSDSSKSPSNKTPAVDDDTDPQPVPPPEPPEPEPDVILNGVNATDADQRRREMSERFNAMISFMKNLNNLSISQKALESSEAKTIEMLEPSKKEQKDTLSMMEYMLIIMQTMIKLAQDGNQVGKSFTDISKASMDVAKSQLDKALDDLKKLQKEIWDYDHRSGWQKFCSAFKSIWDVIKMICPIVVAVQMAIVAGKGLVEGKSLKEMSEKAGQVYKDNWNAFCKDNAESDGIFMNMVAGLMMAVAIVTVQPELFAMGAFMLIMNETGGQEALSNLVNQATGGNLAANIALNCLIGLAEGGAIAGATSMATALLESLATSLAAVSSSAVEIEMATFANNTAANAAETAATGTAAAAAEAAAATATSTTQTAVADIAAALKKILKDIIGKALMMSGTTDLWKDVTKAFIELGNATGNKTGDEKAKEAEMISGMILGVIAGGVGALMEVGANAATAAKAIQEKLSEKGFNTLKNTLKTFATIFTVEQAIYQIQVGINQRKIGEILEDLAKAQGLQTFALFMNTIAQTTMSSNDDNMKAVNDRYQNIINGFDQTFIASNKVFSE